MVRQPASSSAASQAAARADGHRAMEHKPVELPGRTVLKWSWFAGHDRGTCGVQVWGNLAILLRLGKLGKSFCVLPAVKVFLNDAVGIIGKLAPVLWTVSKNWKLDRSRKQKPPGRVVAKGVIRGYAGTLYRCRRTATRCLVGRRLAIGVVVAHRRRSCCRRESPGFGKP